MAFSVLAASWTEVAYVVVQKHLKNIVFFSSDTHEPCEGRALCFKTFKNHCVFLALTPTKPVRGAFCVTKPFTTIVVFSPDTHETYEGCVLCYETF